MTAIKMTGLTLERRSGFRLGPISLELQEGSRTALIGPSGCGKTTLLRCLAGLEEPDAGQVWLDTRMVTNGRVLVPPSNRRIGFVFQDGALWPHLSAVQHLRFVDPNLSQDQARSLLEQVGLKNEADALPGRLSGGERQRLALARALAGKPELLMLDEPLHSVDVHLRDELCLLVRRIAEERNLTLLVVSHDRDEALAMAEDLVILAGGRVVETGPAAEKLSQPRTAYTASFLSHSACLPTEIVADGQVNTPFGAFERPRDSNGTPLCLVLMPGDARMVADAGATPQARVLQINRSALGITATVELLGQTLIVPCEASLQAGAQVSLELSGPPRLLPKGLVEEQPRGEET
jgi:iron(III) transport system ATP-binding protein